MQKDELLEILGAEHEEKINRLGDDPDVGKERPAPLLSLRRRLRNRETFVEHMYRDTSAEGWVTVGYGFALQEEKHVKELSWLDKTTKRNVLPSVALKEWKKVKTLPHGQSHLAKEFKQHTNLFITRITAENYLDRLLRRLVGDVRRRFDQAGIVFNWLPSPVQEAMLDMAYNAGANFINAINSDTGAPTWPLLTSALRRRDWREAAEQSNRPQVGPARNLEIRNLILRALKESEWGVQEF